MLRREGRTRRRDRGIDGQLIEATVSRFVAGSVVRPVPRLGVLVALRHGVVGALRRFRLLDELGHSVVDRIQFGRLVGSHRRE